MSKSGELPWKFEYTIVNDAQTGRWVVEGVAKRTRHPGAWGEPEDEH